MLSDRKCTDIIFAFVIVVVLVAYIGIAVFAYINGNISSLFIPLNSKGDECGGEKYPEKPNLLIFDYSNINLLQTAFSLISSKKFMISAKSKCVKSCPEDFGVPTVKNNICDDGIVISDDRNLLTQIKNKNCAPVNIPTIELLKYCVPDVEKISTSIIDIAKDVKFGDIFLTFEQLTKISSAFSKLSEYKIVFDDFHRVKYYFFLYGAISIFLSMIVILILGIGSYPVIICFYSVSILFLSASTVMFSLLHYQLTKGLPENKIIQSIQMQVENYVLSDREAIYLSLAIVSGVLLFIMLMIFFVIFSSLKKVCACAKEASKSILYIIVMPIVPIISIIVQLALVILWIFMFFELITMSKKEYRFLNFKEDKFVMGQKCSLGTESSATTKCIFAGTYTSYLSIILICVSAFITIWLIFLTKGISIFLVAFAIVRFYCRKSTSYFFLFFSLIEGISTLLVYNIGTIVFGSFLLALLTAIIIVVELLIRLFGFNEENKLKILFGWVKKGLMVLQRLFQILSERTYIVVAISSENFCSSGKMAISFISKNIISWLLIEFFCNIFMVLGILIISGSTATASYFHLKTIVNTEISAIFYSICIGCGAIIVSWAFLNVYKIAITTIYFCIFYDAEVNDGSDERPFIMTDSLRNTFNLE